MMLIAALDVNAANLAFWIIVVAVSIILNLILFFAFLSMAKSQREMAEALRRMADRFSPPVGGLGKWPPPGEPDENGAAGPDPEIDGDLMSRGESKDK
jgi:hypothetical protein